MEKENMIDLVRDYGGQVIKFGGDAITCQFTNGPTGILRACACALAMQEKMAGFRAMETRGGVFELRMKIGISAGSVLFLSVGDQQKGLEYVLIGRPLDRMAEAEHHAAAGEVVIDGACIADSLCANMSATAGAWAELGIIVGEEREGFLLVKGLRQTVERVEQEEVNWDVLGDEVAEQVLSTDAVIAQFEVSPKICTTWSCVYCDPLEVFYEPSGHRWSVKPAQGKGEGTRKQYFTAMQEVIPVRAPASSASKGNTNTGARMGNERTIGKRPLHSRP